MYCIYAIKNGLDYLYYTLSINTTFNPSMPLYKSTSIMDDNYILWQIRTYKDINWIYQFQIL